MSMPPPKPALFPVEDAWKPLPRSHWNAETAAHLLRRVGFSATPEAVGAALAGTPAEAVAAAFGGERTLPKLERLRDYEARAPLLYGELRRTGDEKETRMIRRQLTREDNRNFTEFALQWFAHARREENSAVEKFVLFLQDVFVVERRKVRETVALHDFQQTLRGGLALSYVELCKQVSREPAMVRYLDLVGSKAGRPNENFARELFELFILGEGNYTEADVKEAARAFTGHSLRQRTDFRFRPFFHDKGRKTVFGETGTWDGDDVIDLAFRQPAARTHLIRELLAFYVSDTAVDEAYVEALGERWAARDFSLTFLVETVFQSRLFFHPAYRGNQIKSPTHFYLGLCQDLALDVMPFPSRLLPAMNTMGQPFQNPPNVRGWLYGEHWINATTVAARRQVVDYLFSPLNENDLNGNELRLLAAAREEGRAAFLVRRQRIGEFVEAEAGRADFAARFCDRFIPASSRDAYLEPLRQLIGDTTGPGAADRVRTALVALLQAPAYNLC